MRRKMMIATLAFLSAMGMRAQTIYDGVGLTDRDLNGTARFVGMGGAMGALGGDLSTIGVNPAGLGVFRSYEAAVSFGLSSYGNEAKYAGKEFTSDKFRGDFNSAGVVIATKIGNTTPLRYVNFGINYQRVKSFHRDIQMNGELNGFTQTSLMANQAAGIHNWKDSYTNPEIGWLSALAYDGYLITDLISQPDLDKLLQANPNFNNYKPYMDGDKQVTNLKGDKMYYTPGDYVGMYSGGFADFRSQERGGIDRFDFNVAFNLSDRVYLGMTIGAYTVDYDKYSYYSENFGLGEGYDLQTWSSVEGSGFDLKFGTIIRPFEYSPLRIGLAVHTPTFFNLDYKTEAMLQSDVLNDLSIKNEMDIPGGEIGSYSVNTYDQVGEMVREFKFQTPWTYNVSLGYTVDQFLALGAEYEYKDYSSMKFKDVDGYSDAFGHENSTTDYLKGVHTLRLGMEYKVIPQFAFRVGYNYSTSVFENGAFKDLPINSIQTDTDFSNSESLSNYTLGVGYRGKRVYADLAYKYSSYKSDFYPFDMFDGEALQQATKMTDTRSQVLFTLGFRF